MSGLLSWKFPARKRSPTSSVVDGSVTQFSQRDPRWSSDVMGKSGNTLGLYGCLVTGLASVLADWGHSVTPASLNQFLSENGGYTSDGRLVFKSVEQFGVKFVERVVCYTTPAPIDKLERALLSGEAVLTMVDFKPLGSVQQHWVRLLSLTGHTHGRIMDPWQLPGTELTNLGRYAADGWDAARAIFGAAIYKRGR